MLYVTAIDNIMSGWGKAEGKINKIIFECDDLRTAERIEQKLKARPEMIDINICTTKPKIKITTTQLFIIREMPRFGINEKQVCKIPINSFLVLLLTFYSFLQM